MQIVNVSNPMNTPFVITDKTQLFCVLPATSSNQQTQPFHPPQLNNIHWNKPMQIGVISLDPMQLSSTIPLTSNPHAPTSSTASLASLQFILSQLVSSQRHNNYAHDRIISHINDPLYNIHHFQQQLVENVHIQQQPIQQVRDNIIPPTIHSIPSEEICKNNESLTSVSQSSHTQLSHAANTNQTPRITNKPSPVLETEYKMTENGKFQCLIRNEENGTICNKTLAHRSSLQRHKRVVHDKYKPYICPLKSCSLRFARSSSLLIHSRVHSGERPYKCPDKSCNKAFKQRAHLKEHIRIHTGERPYGCSFCGARFRQKCVLDTHQRIHTKAKPFKCELCWMQFTHYTSFIRHKKNKVCAVRHNNNNNNK